MSELIFNTYLRKCFTKHLSSCGVGLSIHVCRDYDPCNVRLYVIPSTKIDRALRKLDDLGYDAGPDPSSDFSLREGDRLEVAFRGNVICVDERPRLNAVFTTNLDTTVCMRIEQHDVFVQKSYDVYRGFVQLRKVTKIPLSPSAADKKQLAPAAGPPPPTSAAPAPPPAAAAEAEPAASAAPEQEVDAAGDAGTAPVEPAAVEEPPPPMFEIKITMVSELLITFPKVSFTLQVYSNGFMILIPSHPRVAFPIPVW